MSTPPPLTPPECDLRGYDFMPLFGHRLFGSEFYAHASDAAFRAGIKLWWTAWQQCPAGSLPNDDIALCRFADMGRDMKGWKAVKQQAMHGFVLCSDGRWYHPILAEEALAAWKQRLRAREKQARYRNRGGNDDGDVTVTRDQSDGNEDGNDRPELPRRDGNGHGDVTPDRTGQDSKRSSEDLNSDLSSAACAREMALAVRKVVRSVRSEPLYRHRKPEEPKPIRRKRDPAEPPRTVEEQLRAIGAGA